MEMTWEDGWVGMARRERMGSGGREGAVSREEEGGGRERIGSGGRGWGQR